MVRLAVEVARELGLDAERQRNVEFGALLHDVGKIAVPKAIINKPGELDDREWSIIRTHTIEGQRMLERIGGRMRDVGFIVRSSHERWDGGGYPDGLSASAIPLEAQRNVEHDLLTFDPTMKGAKIDLAKTVDMSFQQKAAAKYK